MKKIIKKIRKLKNDIENNKVLNVINKIVKGILYFIMILILIVILVQRVTKNNFAIGGVRIFTIVSRSMTPEYEIGDILISQHTEASDLKIGDNVTYYGKSGDMANLVVTHKIINVRSEDGKYYFTTKGTANDVADPEISQSQIYGKVIYKTLFLSFLGKIMSNIVAYYVLFIIIALVFSYQVVRMIFDKNDEEDNIDGEKTEKKNNI